MSAMSHSNLGKPQPHQIPHYDPSSGRSYRPGVTFPPENAVKLIELGKRANLSLSGVLNKLLEHVEIDPETGLPPFMKQSEPDLFYQEFREAG